VTAVYMALFPLRCGNFLCI